MRPIIAAAAVLATALFSEAAHAASLKIKGTTFGWNPFTESTTAGGPGPLGKYPATPVNQPIEITFDQSLDKASVKETSVIVRSVSVSAELQALGLSSSIPGGQVAPVILEAKGKTLRILPAVLFSGSTVSYGFAPNAVYEVQLVKGGKGIKGKNGAKLSKKYRIGFRTTDVITDPEPGPPEHTIRLIDAVAGAVKLAPLAVANPQPTFTTAEGTPPPQVEFEFDELVLPASVVNAATGESSSLRVQIDQDGLGATPLDRTTVPGTFAVSNSQSKSRVVWTPALSCVTGDALVIITVTPLVEDLVGNTLFELTGDIGAVQVYGFRTKPGGCVVEPLLEPFNSAAKLDTVATSADWAESAPGFLVNGAGGGSGADGNFNAATDTVLTTSVFDPDVGGDVPRVYNFQGFNIEPNVRVTAVGEFPLFIRCAGDVTISGILDVSGAGGQEFSETQVAPGLGGVAAAGGAAGGLGGSVTDGATLTTALFSASIPGYAAPAKATQGLSGITASLTADSLTKDFGNAFNSGFAGLWLQPNTGTGTNPSLYPNASPGNQINTFHPTFAITSVPSSTVLTVETTEFGDLNQPGTDLYELPPPPIAKPGDPFLVGDLAGHAGAASGFADSSGDGSLPLTVAQLALTQVRSGGGGGGGARSAGDAGEDSPTFGSASGTAGAAGGGGALTGTVLSATATTLTATSPLFTGLSLGAGANPDLDPSFIVFPNVATGAMLEIVSNTASVLTVKSVNVVLPTDADANDDGVIDLLDVQGLSAGSTFRVEASLRRGGAGGGGSGVHCAGSTKLTASPNLTLPTWTAGSGGGAGGGALIIEASGLISVQSNGSILARGGDGGRTTGALGSSASGGGGGGGGTVVLRSASLSAFAVKVDGLVDASGGTGGIGLVEGGGGGDGRVRLESAKNNLVPANFPADRVLPAVTAADFGFFLPGQSASVGQSKFYFTETLDAAYTSYTVTYNATINGVPMTGLTYTSADFTSGVEAPFDITFNTADIGANGQIDFATLNGTFTPDITTLTGSYIRFKLTLNVESIIEGDTYSDVAIDSVAIEFDA